MTRLNPDRALGYIEAAFMWVAVAMLLTMLTAMVVDAAGRYVFNSPLAGNFEFTTFVGMVVLTYLALPRVYTMGGHIRLEFLQPLLSRVPFALPQRLNALLAALCFGAITLYAGEEAIHKVQTRETTIGLVQIPIYISYLAFPLGCGTLTLRMILEIFIPADHRHSIEDEL